MNKRKQFSSMQRRRVEASTEGRCFYCHTKLEHSWVMEHMIPISRGGKMGLSNIVPSCKPCDQLKSDQTAEEFIARNKLAPLDFKLLTQRQYLKRQQYGKHHPQESKYITWLRNKALI